ncbi:MAG: hypothetical protein EB084_01895 [Proteobacteria bacterium]|nr:hypothetical protein [Pseudomonadota bacterium]
MNMRTRKRGVALITVLIILSLCLFFVTAVLIRSNNTIFMVNHQMISTQARYVAEAAAMRHAELLEDYLRKLDLTQNATAKNDPQMPVNAGQAAQGSGALSNQTIYNAAGSVIGYATVTIQSSTQVMSTNTANNTQSVAGSVIISSTGWTLNVPGLTRTVKLVYTLSGTVSTATTVAPPSGPSPVFNYAYFMNHWAWWSGFSQGQALIFGNTGANGNFDILGSGTYLGVNPTNMAPVNVNGTMYNDPNASSTYSSPFASLSVHTNTPGQSNPNPNYGTLASAGGSAAPQPSPVSNVGKMQVPMNLNDIANESGSLMSQTVANWRDPVTNQPPSLKMNTYEVTSTNPFTLASVPISSRNITTTGTYGTTGSGQKENVVLAGTPISQMVAGYNQNLSVNGKPTVDVIAINGPVVVKGNIVMQGLIEGRGSLYAGRNMYVAGNVQYKGGDGPTSAPPYDYPTNGQTGNGSSTTPVAAPTPTASDYTSASLVSYVAGGSVVYGDVTSSNWNSQVMAWLNYTDPVTGQKVNDNHEDAGLDSVVNSKQSNPNDSKENDAKWTVQIQDSNGNVQWSDLTISNGQAVVPNGYSVVPGTGEDTDGNGRYTQAYNYTRDFQFASRQDSSGNYSTQTFTSSFFDQFPSSASSYTNYCTPVTRIDGYVVSNYAIAGLLGDGGSRNVVSYGSQVGRQECMIVNIGSKKQLLYQDPRLTQTTAPANFPVNQTWQPPYQQTAPPTVSGWTTVRAWQDI